jgi:hypothetical protein
MGKVRDITPGQAGAMKLSSEYVPPSRAKVYLMNATSESNCDILSDIREIVQNQVMQLKHAARDSILTVGQADVLMKLTKVYQVMDSSTDKEHNKYDFSQLSEEKLKKLSE